MLQQTTVATVIPYYRRFLRRFPDLKSLARSSEGTVLKHWAGLGYYSRARNLRLAAKEIMSRHGGRFPEEQDDLLALPGIGRYTAGAVGSIAFSRPVPLVDGNVIRVLSRWFALRGPSKEAAQQRRLWDLAKSLVSPDRPGDWNQSLMELGAVVCLPENPRCGNCPVIKLCSARRLGLENKIPLASKRPETKSERWECLWIERQGRVLLWKRSPEEKLLKGLWGLPESRHLQTTAGRLLGRARHSITRYQISIAVRAAEPPKRLPPSARWVQRERLEDYLISSLWLKCLPDKPAREPLS